MRFSIAGFHALIILTTALPVSLAQQVSYTVELRDTTTEIFHVTIETPVTSDTAISLFFPAWATGNYIVNDFGRWIGDVAAWDSSGAALPVRQKGVNEWRIASADRLARITYTARDIPEDSLESLPTTLNEIGRDFCFFNGPTVLGYLEPRRSGRVQISLKLPAHWKAWCSLDSIAPATFAADDYDQLIDSPVLAGTERIREYRFDLKGASYVLVVNSETDVPMDSLTAFTRILVDHHTTFFNEIPFRQYYFLFNFLVGDFKYGALEHSNSSAYYLAPPFSQRYLRVSTYTSVISHEFFHLWNPKLFYPDPLGPFDYQKTPQIRSMWFIEGLTEYYARLAMVRSGLSTTQPFYDFLKSLAMENSRDNLEQLGMQAGRIGVAPSMYTKGALVSLLLDIEIRDRTGNKKSLDDVVLEINRRYGHRERGYPDKELFRIIEDIAGLNLSKFYNKYMAGTDELPVEAAFRKAGLLYTYVYPPFLGWSLDVNENNRLLVTVVAEQSTASAMGLETNDVIRQINRRNVPTDLDSIRGLLLSLQSLKVGDAVTFEIERAGIVKTLSGKVIESQLPNVRVIEDPEAPPKAIAIRNGILYQKK